MFMSKTVTSTLTALVLSFVIGCGDGVTVGPTGEVEGSVTLDGQPLTEGAVSLYDPSTGNSGGGELDAEGKFKFTQPVPVGKYRVSILPPEAPAPDDAMADMEATRNTTIHPLYQNGDTSELTANVTEGQNTYTFALTKGGPRS